MARILQVTCDNPVCYNMIELVDHAEFNYIRESLEDFGWGVIEDEDYCPDCYDDSDEEEDHLI